MFYLCPGLLGAAPAIPLLANPALSAALLQILLQNQAKVQQVLQTYWNFSAEHILMSVVFHSLCLIRQIFFFLLVFSVDIQQAFLGNHLLWAQVLYS